jgi:hypothetical protein
LEGAAHVSCRRVEEDVVVAPTVGPATEAAVSAGDHESVAGGPEGSFDSPPPPEQAATSGRTASHLTRVLR